MTDTADGVIVRIGRTVRNFLTFSSDKLSSINTDTSLDGGIISFIFVALRNNVALDAVSIVVSVIAKVAFTSDSIEGFISSTSSASVQDPEVSIIAVALTVLKVTVDSTVLVAAAFSIDDSVSSIADAALSSLVPVSVKRTFLRIFAFSVVDGHTVGADTFSIDISGSSWAKCLTVSSIFSISWFAKASIRVRVIVLTWITVGANSSDLDVLRFANTSVCGC